MDVKWIIEMVDECFRGRDGLVREVKLKYKKYKESDFRDTTRSVRKVVKLWAVEDSHLTEDLEEMARWFESSRKVLEEARVIPENGDGEDGQNQGPEVVGEGVGATGHDDGPPLF
jgi:hypothetical protein